MALKPMYDRQHLKEALEKGPRSDKGDPLFTDVTELAQFFDTQDVLALVNRALYQLEYQTHFHRKRAEEAKMLRQQAREQKTLSMLDTGRSKELVATAFSRMNPIHFAPAHVEKLVAEFEPTQEDEGPTEDELRLYEAFARPAPAAPTSTSTSTNDERKRT